MTPSGGILKKAASAICIGATRQYAIVQVSIEQARGVEAMEDQDKRMIGALNMISKRILLVN